MRTAFRTIALTSLLALGAVACDQAEPGTSAPQGGGNLDPEAILQQASEDLSEQTIEATFAMTGEGGGQSFAMSGDMLMDPKAELAQMTFVIEGMPELEGGAEMEMILDGSTMYMRGPMFGGDDRWVKIDASAAGADDPFGGSGQMDPSAFLDFLRGADGIEAVGTEDVRGHETTHYSGTINPSDLTAAVPGDERDQVEDALEGLEGQMGPLDMTFDAWVDGAGVPWRVAIAFAPEDVDASFKVTFDLIEIGGDVEIEVPSGADVTDFGDMGMPTAS